MAKKQPQARQQATDDPSGNDRPIEVATVAWMMAVMTTLVCGTVAGLVWLVAHDRADAESAMLFGHVIHFSAIVTGLISLMLMAVVLKTGRIRPPTSILIGSTIIAIVPLLVAVLR